MLGKTHMAAGAATALAVLQPTTVSGCVCAVAGGVVGGWICDIDVRRYSAGGIEDSEDKEDKEELEAHRDKCWQVLVFMLIITAICFCIDHFAGNGMCEYITSHLGIPMFIAGAVFAGVCAYGFASAHRTVMHSILGGLVLVVSLHIICAPLAPAFALGYLSHIVLDLFNKRRIQLFWPLKTGVKFGFCSSNGTANKVIGAISLVACLILFPLYLVPSISGNYNFSNLFHVGGEPSAIFSSLGFTKFQLYLICINILSFLVYLIDYLAWNRGAYGDDPEIDKQDFVHTVFLLLPAAGGALGMLLAVLFGTKGKLTRGENGSIGFYTHGLCFLVMWTCIYLIACNPFNISVETSSIASLLKEHHIILIVFAILIALAFVIFLIDKRQYRKINIKEIGEFILAFIGGATGAYLAMALSNHKMTTAQFGQGVPLMIAMHYVILTIGFFNGYL